MVEAASSSYGGDEVLVGDPPGRRRRVGVEHDGAVAHQPSGDDGVATELATTEHTDRGRRDDHDGGGSVDAAAWPRRSARYDAQGHVEQEVVGGEHGHSEQGGVGRPRLADGERGDWDARRHLHDRQQRVLALEVT